MIKKITWLLALVFITSLGYSEGFRVEARANFMGEAELSLAGSKNASNPNGSGRENVNGKANNNLGFSLLTGYEDALSKQLMLFLGLSFNQYKTEVMALDSSFDNKSISGQTLALYLSGQFKFYKRFFLEAGISFPIKARFEGSFDNETGTDKVDLEGRLSYDISLAYRVSNSFRVSLGYAIASMRKEKPLTNVDIGLDISHFFLGLDYVF